MDSELKRKLLSNIILRAEREPLMMTGRNSLAGRILSVAALAAAGIGLLMLLFVKMRALL